MTSLLDHLSDQAKQGLDRASYCLAGVSGSAITYANVMDALNMAAVIIAILSGLASLGWTIWRWRRDNGAK